MAISFEVPQWLQPPSPAEQQRIDMAKQQAQERAAMMMQRYIGSQRAQRDAQAAIANGVDPITARQNALLNNAHLLFADNPEAVSNLVNRAEANDVRNRANLQIEQHRQVQDLLKQNAIEQAQQRVDEAAKHNIEMEEAKNRELDIREQLSQERAAKSETTPEIRVLTNPDTGEKLSVVRTGPNTWQPTERRPGQVGELEKMQLGSLYSELRSANRDLQQLGAPTEKDNDITINSRAALVNRKSQIQKQIDKLSGKKSGKPATPPAAPSGRVKVKSPDGKIGTIPADQLDDALKEGYEKVE